MNQFTNDHGKKFPIVQADQLNLDCEPDTNYLMSFWCHYQRGRNARELFPQGGKGTRNATADLANYASNKATAMRCRLEGRIETAVGYERICDSIYSRMDDFAKGW